MRVRAAINNLGAVECKRPRILRIGSLISHHDPEPANLSIHNRPESIERESVLLHPPVEDVVRTYRMLHREEWRNLVVPKDDFSLWIDNEAYIEKPILPVWMMGLGLTNHEGTVFLRDST